jgi:hypothetical protein
MGKRFSATNIYVILEDLCTDKLSTIRQFSIILVKSELEDKVCQMKVNANFNWK